MRTSSEGSDILIKYGQNSKERVAYVQDFMAKDHALLEQIEWYLDKYGYPSKAALGKDAAMAPWLVIHHCTDIGVRNSHFGMLQQAYADGNITDDAFTMNLGRTYQFQFGERLKMESPYTVDDEIGQLILELGLGQDS